jgi:hypothetical protein
MLVVYFIILTTEGYYGVFAMHVLDRRIDSLSDHLLC